MRVSALLLMIMYFFFNSCGHLGFGSDIGNACNEHLEKVLEEMSANGTLDQVTKDQILDQLKAAEGSANSDSLAKSRRIESLDELVGVYQSLEACEFQMPRWIDKEGPRAQISIQFFSDYRGDFMADSQKGKYFCFFEYRDNYTNDDTYNHFHGKAEVLKMMSDSAGVTLQLKAIECSQYPDFTPELVASYEPSSQPFELRIEAQKDGKFKMTTKDAPVECYQAWNWVDMELFPLLWSQ